MVSKYELTISTEYVPHWGLVEAFRELFQNALDNEIVNPENKMSWEFNGDTIRISNKTSKLSIESLLLGSSTKRKDNRTVGKWGEGYKIAFMVLLRNNKGIKVYNYGAREVWEVRLVKSKRFNGQLITTVFVNKEAVWKKVPDNDLTIEVTGVTEDEIKEITKNNLNLREDTLEFERVANKGRVLLNEEEKGNIYVKGLYVCKNAGLYYGYDFEPEVINLDRDRRLVNDFNLSWECSCMWSDLSKINSDLKNKAVELLQLEAKDVRYVANLSVTGLELRNAFAEHFFEVNGSDAVAVTSSEEYEEVKRESLGRPVIVSSTHYELLSDSSIIGKHTFEKAKVTIYDKFKGFMDKIESKLDDEELDEFQGLIDELKEHLEDLGETF